MPCLLATGPSYEGQQSVSHKPTGERLDVLNRQHMDVLEDVPVGSKVGVPVVDAKCYQGVTTLQASHLYLRRVYYILWLGILPTFFTVHQHLVLYLVLLVTNAT